MKIEIISYNRKAAHNGLLLIHLGFAILLINFIPYLFYNYFEMLVVYFSVVLIFSGILIEGYFTSETKKVGYLIFEDQYTQVSIDNNGVNFINSDTNVEFSKAGYKGKYSPFLTLGSLRTSTGINTICLSDEIKKVEFEILFKSKNEYYEALEIIKNSFKK